MNCSKNMEMFFEETDMPLLHQVQVWAHTFFCPACTEEIARYQSARTVMREDFFPSSPDCPEYRSWSELEDSIMSRLHDEQTEIPQTIPGIPSTRGWVIAGVILIISLVTAFFGLDFQKLATETGMSFMLPMGITIGIVLTTYCALFIGSHLKELSERFGL